MSEMHHPVLPDLFVVEVEQLPAVPIAPSASIQAKHCSAMCAEKVSKTRESLWKQMRYVYSIGPRTDVEMARTMTGVFGRTITPSTISARRAELIKQGLVHLLPVGIRKNEKTGVSNSLWGLTEKGRQR